MHKPLIIVIITIVLLTIGMSGCTDNTNGSSKVNEEKILGLWTETIPGTPLTVTMNFVTNMSYYESINETRIWGTYTMTDKMITLQSAGIKNTFTYSFSEDWNTLTLHQTGNEEVYLVLARQ